MEHKRLLPPLVRSSNHDQQQQPPPAAQEVERALLLLLHSAHAPLPSFSHPPQLAPERSRGSQRRILPRPSPPAQLSAPPEATETSSPREIAAAATRGDDSSPPPQLPLSRSTSGVSTHSTASSCLSVAELVADLAVVRSQFDGNDDATDAPRPPATKPLKKKRVRLKTERRREQCRANQARYRNKQRDHATVLAERVAQLRAEVRLLEQQSREQIGVDTISSNSERALWVAAEYFRLFRHGFAMAGEDDDTAAAALRAPHETPPSVRQQQLAFLASSMAPTLRLGWDVCGVDALVEQWRRYSQYHDDLVLELVDSRYVENVGLDASVESMVHATASLRATITRETLARVFPHLMSGASAAGARIAKTLVGARVTYPWRVVFEFDARGVVQRLTSTADFAAPLMAILRSAEDVALVLNGARVQHAWHLGDVA